MKANKGKYLITSALPYANGPLHIGHIAGAYLPADIFVRFLRSRGDDVVFICGSDEHGAAITLRAKKEGVNPLEIVDRYHEINQKAFNDFGISFDIYHRTSSKLHHETAQEFFKELESKGSFEVKTSEQFYDESENQFLADRYITGTCPKCSYDKAYGDQCEKCGSSLSPAELINPKSVLSGNEPVLRETSHWFLPMEKHENWLKEWISTGMLDGSLHHDPSTWKKHVTGQCLSWIDGGLHARAMTRDLEWGVPVPMKNAEGKVLYVWLDAPIGYISATRQWAEEQGKNWEDYWKSNNTQLIHFIGKDNIVFHCIIFPIILKEHGGYNLPVNVPANEFLNLEGEKISTSRNHAVWLHEYLEDFPEKKDELRYVLNLYAPETSDNEFTWNDYQQAINNELVAVLGNFINRIMVLSNKYFDGNCVVKSDENLWNNLKGDFDELPVIIGNVESGILAYKFRQAMAEVMKLARTGNAYLTVQEPWKIFKSNPEKVKEVLSNCLQLIANLSIAVEPFLPDAATRIQNMLNITQKLVWKDLGNVQLLPEGHCVSQASLLFEKIEDSQMEFQKNKLKKEEIVMEEPIQEAVVIKPEITFDDFAKMDIRTGVILEAEKVEKADKLLKLKVDTGVDVRTIVSGIAQHFSPEEIIGKHVSVLLNLAPRKIRGEVSNGMILMAEDENGKLSFVKSEDGQMAGDVVG